MALRVRWLDHVYVPEHCDFQLFLVNMPTEYKRRYNQRWRLWTNEALLKAVEAVHSGKMGVNAATRNFGIAAPTLRRQIKSQDFAEKTLRPPSLLGKQNEARLKAHVRKLKKIRFRTNT
ncbi:uncharacterized protein LOC143371427 [Andrena cerasifolii]|uniref:uncharacterized protein LOC143371427 n=1 Tax=Andrena cerasifolii TaxID=2819439 RepID=UPI0040381313